MNNKQSKLVWGVLLILAGVMFMLQELNILGNASQYLWVILMTLGAGTFLWVYITKKEHWWAIIPGLTLLGLALVALEDILNILPGSDWSGGVFLACIGVAFWLVYFRNRLQWWAIIPGGVMVTLALVAGLESLGDWTEVVFFLGLAFTFGLVAVLPNQSHDTRWAYIPAGVLFILGLALFAPVQSMMQILWPLALVGLGVYLLVRTWK
jgi:hypothetical protein